jgi:hypothetical protein
MLGPGWYTALEVAPLFSTCLNMFFIYAALFLQAALPTAGCTSPECGKAGASCHPSAMLPISNQLVMYLSCVPTPPCRSLYLILKSKGAATLVKRV